MNPMTVQSRARQLVREHGGYRAAARAIGMSPPQLWRLCDGKSKKATPASLTKLGLQHEPHYYPKRPIP